MLTLVVCLTASAQELRFREFGRPEGLPGGHVFAVRQDRAGWLWVGHSRGLHQFDGHTFHAWTASRGVPESPVYAVQETADGRLWVLAKGGLAFLPPNETTFQRVDVPVADIRYLKNGLAASGNRLLVADGRTMWLIDSRPGKTSADLRSIAAPDLLRGIAVDGQGTAWAICGQALCRLDLNGGNPHLTPVDAGLPQEPWLAIAAGAHGELALRGVASLWVRAPGADRFTRDDDKLEATSVETAALAYSPEGELLATDAGGLAVGRRQGNRRQWRNVGVGNGLPTSAVSAIALDREGAAWLGMASDPNLVQWDRRARWEVWTRRQGLNEDIIWGSAQDRSGAVWAAGNGGLFRLTGGRFTAVQSGGREYFRKPLAAPDGSIFVLVNHRIVRRIQGNSVQDFPVGEERVRSLLLDASHRLWAFGSSIHRSSDVTRGPLSFEAITPLGASPDDRYTHATLDAHGRIVAAGSSGVVIFDPGTEKWQRLSTTDGLSQREVQAVLADSSGRLWLGYQNRRAPTRLHYVNGRWQADRLMLPPELNPAVVVSFAEDREKRIWVGTESGLFVWNGTAWRRYGIEDGLRSEDCVTGALRVDDDGGIWAGTGRGLAYLSSTQAPVPPLPLPGAAITDFEQSGNTVQFSLRSLSYWRPQEQLFLYRVHGRRFYGTVFDSGWVESHDPEAAYQSLPAGDYSIELKTRNAEQGWSVASARHQFAIPVPWYGTGWFLTAALAGLPLAWRGLHRRRQHLRAAQEAIQARRVEEEIARHTRHLAAAAEQSELANQRKGDLLAALSEQIRRPLHGLNGLLELSLSLAKDGRQRQYLESALESSGSVLAMVGDVLDFAETEGGRPTVRQEPCDVREVVRGAMLTLQASPPTSGGALSWEVAAGVPALVIGDPQRLRHVLLHLATRVCRQPDSTGVSVRVELQYASPDAVVLVFGAYDPGAPPSLFAPLEDDALDQRNGLELAIAARWIEWLGGRLTACGTGHHRSFRFSLRLPRVEEHAGQRPRVLLAEEDVRNRRVTAALLEQAGFAVTAVSSGAEAVALAPEADVLLIDPEATAFEALNATRQIRSAESEDGRHKIRIVGLSTSHAAGDRERWEEAGMDKVLTKPVRLEDLLPAIRNGAHRTNRDPEA